MHARARTLPADAIILDLEDSVAPADKDRARTLVGSALEEGFPGHLRVFIRPNGPATDRLEGDLRSAVSPGLAGVVVPKLREPDEVEHVATLLDVLESERGLTAGDLRLILLIERPLAVLNAYAMARASARVVALQFGADDLAAEMGLARTPENAEVAYPRAHVALAAHAAGVDAIDIVYTAFRDVDGFRREAEAGRALGYTGKQCIHPLQVEPANEIFAPLPEEIAWAERVVAAYEAAPRGAAVLEGRMIDAPTVARARRILAGPVHPRRSAEERGPG